MADRTQSQQPGVVPIRLAATGSQPSNDRRRAEPVSIGIPLPRGFVEDPSRLGLYGPDGRLPLQSRALDRWPDGSIRWALLDFQADFDKEGQPYEVRSDAATEITASQELSVSEAAGEVVVNTGAATFRMGPGRAFPFREIAQSSGAEGVRGELTVSGPGGASWKVAIERVVVEEAGTLRVAVALHGRIDGDGKPQLEVSGRLHFFAGSPTVKVILTVRNPRRAVHPGGLWDLGDAGSVLLRELGLKFTLPSGDRPSDIHWAAAPGRPVQHCRGAFELYQDSSGGEHWRSPNHLNREHRIPLAFRGYRIRAAGTETTDLRATPAVTLKGPDHEISLAVPAFWENFPKAIESDGDSLAVGLFPRQFGDLHEIQGGEQKTHTLFVGFGPDRVTAQPLAWCVSPLQASAPPEWNCSTGALPYLVPATENPNREYLELVNAAIDGPDAFAAKREVIDEYGWRHFGDIYGDHETAYAPPRESPLVSHYNNQYDPIAGFAYQFLSTGDRRWHEAMCELATHVVDIDIYHTTEDKSAYNHGLFWHTFHYVDADTATHRSYPAASRSIVGGGGPSAEQNYATGLALHYFLTGNEDSRRTAIDLAKFVIDVDDGRKTVFRWLDRGATGLATASDSPTYHGPGRASANSLSALVDGHRLSADPQFIEKAQELIRRCIHPLDDIGARDLLDVEGKWFYTMFLQSLGKYLDYKIERGELDDMYAYARESLLQYGRWMAKNERPYLDKPEILDYPTETWAAQDMRKSDVFKYAAKHAQELERETFLERSEFFFRYSVTKLASMPTRAFTRPVVVLLGSGMMHAAFQKNPALAGPAPHRSGAFGRPEDFTPQRVRAIRRLRVVAAGATILLLLAAILIVLTLF